MKILKMCKINVKLDYNNVLL